MSADILEIERILDSLSGSVTKTEMEKIARDVLASQSLSSLCGVSEKLIETIDAKAMNLISLKSYDTAIVHLQLLSLLCPNKYRYWLFLGICLHSIGSNDEALKSLSMATILNHQDPFVHYISAHCYLNLNEKDDATLCLHKTVELSQKNPEFKSILKDALLLLNNPHIAKQRN